MKYLQAIVGTALALSTVSCTTPERSKWKQEDLDALDREYGTYVTSALPEARRALLRCLGLLQHSDPEAHGRAHAIWLTYARLHSLEHRARNQDKKAIYFQHAKYWFLRRLEDRGVATSEIVERIEQYTPSRSLEMMRKWEDSYRKRSEQPPAR